MNQTQKRGCKPKVSDIEIINAVKKLGLDIFFSSTSVKGEKDCDWHKIIQELKWQIKVHNLRTRIKNKINFFFNEITPNKVLSKEDNADVGCRDTFDSRIQIRNLLNDCVLRPLLPEISRSPFHITMYWPEQTAFWRRNSRKLNFVSILNAYNIDISLKKYGEIVNTNIVLFQVMSEYQCHAVPLFQTFIDTSDNEYKEKPFVKYIFGELLQEVSACRVLLIEVPSFPLFEASCLRYNFSSFEEYNVDCFNCLMSNKDFPACIIRSNIFSFINYLKISSHFEDERIKKDSIVYNFYLNCITCLGYFSEFESFLDAIIQIFILLISEVKNTSVTKALGFFHKMFKDNFFEKTLKSHIQYKDVYSLRMKYDPFFRTAICNEQNQIYNYFQDIIETQVICQCSPKSNEVHEELNSYSSKTLQLKFQKILLFFPTWTNIVKNKHNSHWTSCYLEKISTVSQEHCHDIRNEIFEKHGDALEASAFIVEYGHFLRKKCEENRKLLESASNVDLHQNLEIEKNLHSYFRHKDNWMGRMHNDLCEKFEYKVENLKNHLLAKDDTAHINENSLNERTSISMIIISI